MTGYPMDVFILLLLVWNGGALDKEHDWTFGIPKLNIATNKRSNYPKAVDGDFNTFAQPAGDSPHEWTVDLGANYTVAMIRMYPKAPLGSIHDEAVTNNITIWTSSAETPGGIFNSSNWKNVTYAHTVYGYGVTADYQPPAQIRHLGVTTTKRDLRISEFQVFAPLNLAQYRYPSTSEDNYQYDDKYLLGFVDGDYGGKVELSATGKKWISIDFNTVYSIRMIEVFECNDFDAEILTTKEYSPGQISESEDGWTPNSHTSVGPDGEMVFEFSTSILEVQRVALVSYKSPFLTVAEIVIYEYNYALGKNVTIVVDGRVDANLSNSASKIVDGDLSTFLEMSDNLTANLSLDFGKMIFFRKALIYVRTGYCRDHYCSRWFYSKKIYALTSGESKLCLHVANSIGDSFVLECDETESHPSSRRKHLVSRGLKIVSSARNIELREIVVYGKELPTMEDVEIEVERVDNSSVTLTFTQWNSSKSGSRPPDKYILRNEGKGTLDQTVFIHSGGSHFQTTIREIQRNDLISVYVECEVNGEKCAGPPAEVYYFFLYEGQTRPTESAPTTDKVQNITGIIVGVTLAITLLVLAGIGAVIVIKKKRTTAGKGVGNSNKLNRVLPMVRERMAKFTKPKAAVPVSKLPDIRVGLRHA